MNNKNLTYYICFQINKEGTGKESYIKNEIGFKRLLLEEEFNNIQQIMVDNLAKSLNISSDYITPISKREYDIKMVSIETI